MKEIISNRWYTLYEAFGDSLFDIDRHWMKENSSGKRLLSKLSQRFTTTFKDGELWIDFEWQHFSLDDLSKTHSGEHIHFPIEKPNFGYFEGFRTFPSGATRPQIGNYAELRFSIKGALQEDLVGEAQEYTDIFGEKYKSQTYGYRFALKAIHGIFVSDGEASFQKNGPIYVLFYKWRPIDSEQTCVLYAPLEYQKLAPVEIMLQQRNM